MNIKTYPVRNFCCPEAVITKKDASPQPDIGYPCACVQFEKKIIWPSDLFINIIYFRNYELDCVTNKHLLVYINN